MISNSDPGVSHFNVIATYRTDLCQWGCFSASASRPFGISEEIAFAASVLFRVCQWLAVTLAGVYYFITGGLHVGEVRGEVELAEEEGDR